MLQIMTLPQIAQKCRELDPDTAINRDMLYTLCREGIIPFSMHGNRMVAEFSEVIGCITNRLMLYDLRSFPKVRTVRNAARDLRKENIVQGINETHIRAFLKSDSLRSLKVGNRQYIALQSFERPYNQSLFGCIRKDKPKDGFRFRTAQVQIEEIRSQCVKPPVVHRVKN